VALAALRSSATGDMSGAGVGGGDMAQSQRGTALTIFAIAFALLAISNFLKPLQLGGAQTGFVFFGQRLSGPLNTIMGPLFGIFLAVYAFGIWTMRRWAIPMGHAYATYVVLNLILYSFRNTTPDTASYKVFMVVYAAIAIGVALGSAVMLTQRKAELT
jgi:hypothetical protein